MSSKALNDLKKAHRKNPEILRSQLLKAERALSHGGFCQWGYLAKKCLSVAQWSCINTWQCTVSSKEALTFASLSVQALSLSWKSIRHLKNHTVLRPISNATSVRTFWLSKLSCVSPFSMGLLDLIYSLNANKVWTQNGQCFPFGYELFEINIYVLFIFHSSRSSAWYTVDIDE